MNISEYFARENHLDRSQYYLLLYIRGQPGTCKMFDVFWSEIFGRREKKESHAFARISMTRAFFFSNKDQ